MDTDPRDRLAAWLRWSGRSQADLAHEVGCGQTFVSALLRKRKRLDSVNLAVEIERVTGAPQAVGEAGPTTWSEGPIPAQAWTHEQPIVDVDASEAA